MPNIIKGALSKLAKPIESLFIDIEESFIDKYGIIYKATNIVNGKVYIGQTKFTLENRKYGHLFGAKLPNCYFHKALNKYGEENFIWEEIDYASSLQDLNDKEIDWIWFYYSNNSQFGYNMTKGGEGTLGRIKTQEECEQIRKRQTGKKFSEEHKRKIGEKSKGRKKTKPFFDMLHKRKGSKKLYKNGIFQIVLKEDINSFLNDGWEIYVDRVKRLKNENKVKKPRIVTKETRQKISKTLTGRKPSEETLKKRSASLKGKNKGKKHSKEQNDATSKRFKGVKRSPESIQKSIDGRKWYRPSEETKQKISKAHIGMRYNDEFKAKCSKNSLGRSPGNKGSKKMIKDGKIRQVMKNDIHQFINDGWTFYHKVK